MKVVALLSKEDIIKIHSGLKAHTPGIASQSNLDFIFDLFEDYPEITGIEVESNELKITHMAGYLLFHLVKAHCFGDGNKRTAFLSFGTFLRINGFELNYNEEKVALKLQEITIEISHGKSPLEGIELIFSSLALSHEKTMIKLLFDLAGANSHKEYVSPTEIISIVETLIKKGSTTNIMEDKKTSLRKSTKSKFTFVDADPAEVMKISKELMKKYKHTLELLEKM